MVNSLFSSSSVFVCCIFELHKGVGSSNLKNSLANGLSAQKGRTPVITISAHNDSLIEIRSKNLYKRGHPLGSLGLKQLYQFAKSEKKRIPLVEENSLHIAFSKGRKGGFKKRKEKEKGKITSNKTLGCLLRSAPTRPNSQGNWVVSNLQIPSLRCDIFIF
jgi:hypothetical protein